MNIIIKACRKEVSITKEDLSNLYKGYLDDDAANDNFKCFVKCTMDKEGSFSNGSFNTFRFIKNSKNIPVLKEHQTEVLNAVEQCKSLNGTSDCDTAFQITRCLRQRIAMDIINL